MKRHRIIQLVCALIAVASFIFIATHQGASITEKKLVSALALLSTAIMVAIIFTEPDNITKPPQLKKIEIDGHELWIRNLVDPGFDGWPDTFYTKFYFTEPKIIELQSWLYGVYYKIPKCKDVEVFYGDFDKWSSDELRKICRTIIDRHQIAESNVIAL